MDNLRIATVRDYQADKPVDCRGHRKPYKSLNNRGVKVVDDDADDIDFRVTTTGEMLVDQLLGTVPGTDAAVMASAKLVAWARG